jgi:hypothetical protein
MISIKNIIGGVMLGSLLMIITFLFMVSNPINFIFLVFSLVVLILILH